jgi:hypothetical protein
MVSPRSCARFFKAYVCANAQAARLSHSEPGLVFVELDIRICVSRLVFEGRNGAFTKVCRDIGVELGVGKHLAEIVGEQMLAPVAAYYIFLYDTCGQESIEKWRKDGAIK